MRVGASGDRGPREGASGSSGTQASPIKQHGHQESCYPSQGQHSHSKVSFVSLAQQAWKLNIGRGRTECGKSHEYWLCTSSGQTIAQKSANCTKCFFLNGIPLNCTAFLGCRNTASPSVSQGLKKGWSSIHAQALLLSIAT